MDAAGGGTSCSIREIIRNVFATVMVVSILFMLYFQVNGVLQPTGSYGKSQVIDTVNSYIRKTVFNKDDKSSKFWYHLVYKENNISTDIYVHRFYLDDRNEKFTNARTFLTVQGKRAINAKCRLYFENAHIDKPAVMADVTIVAFSANNILYYTYMTSCFFNEKEYLNIRTKLKSVSFLFNTTETEKIPVVIPEKRTDSVKDSMCLCLSPQYGKVTDKLYAPYIVQWVEVLKMLGVSSIIWKNASMISDGIYVNKVLNYYANTGDINLQQIPIPFKHNKSQLFPGHLGPTGDAHASEILRPAMVNDCLYRNMYKQWYIVHNDKDELIIPYKKNQTYQDYIKGYIARQPHTSNLPALAAPSGFFYLSNKRTRSNVSDHFPLLKFTYRQPTEPRHKSPGYSKSFINPRSCSNLWNHRCIKAGDNAFVYLPEKEIQSHHYRYKCSPAVDILIRGRGQGCDTEESRQFEDNIIGDLYGDILRKRTLDVLKKINYK